MLNNHLVQQVYLCFFCCYVFQLCFCFRFFAVFFSDRFQPPQPLFFTEKVKTFPPPPPSPIEVSRMARFSLAHLVPTPLYFKLTFLTSLRRLPLVYVAYEYIFKHFTHVDVYRLYLFCMNYLILLTIYNFEGVEPKIQAEIIITNLHNKME